MEKQDNNLHLFLSLTTANVNMTKLTKDLAECVGLWLAEGDRKTEKSITFTNNCFDLVKHFHMVLTKLFIGNNYKIYLSIYSPNGEPIQTCLRNVEVRNYSDKRANKPYYIWRINSVILTKKWRDFVQRVTSNPGTYPELLRGFFAGEGNVKTGSHKNRVIRISQKNPLKIIDDILSFYQISFTFSKRERAYVITGRWNWDKLAKLNIADLHPYRKQKFWDTYSLFKEYHYSKNFIKDNLRNSLIVPKTSKELASDFSRSQARIQDILLPIKKEGNIFAFRVGSKTYWTFDNRQVILSKRKKQILKFLNFPKITSEVAKHTETTWKSTHNRLVELKKLKLIDNCGTLWYLIPFEKELVVI